MLLPSSAILTIDVRARRFERVLGVLASLGLAGAGMLLFPPFSFLSVAFFIFVTAAIIAGLWLHGWLGGARRLARIARLPDGRWQLRDARHTDVIAELRAANFAVMLKGGAERLSCRCIPQLSGLVIAPS